MKKLTKQQQEQQEQVRLALIESNEPLLFDIKAAIETGIESKKKIEALNKKNAEVVEAQKKLCLADFNKIQDFLGEYKDLVQMYGSGVDESGGHFGYTVGKEFSPDKAIFISYYFLRDWWEDSDNFETINGKRYPIYYAEYLEAWSDVIGETETYDSIETMFNEFNYDILISKLLTEYIIKKL
jgi:hypothetical protein